MEEPLRVLVVEDDPAALTMLALSLRQAGFCVDTADNASQALLLLRQNSYDGMVTDGRMKPVDGFELSQAAKCLQPSLRIFMVSALYSQQDIVNYPIEEIFSKPIQLETLVERLSSFPRNPL